MLGQDLEETVIGLDLRLFDVAGRAEGEELDPVARDVDEPAGPALGQGLDRGVPEPGRQDAVDGGRPAAPLDVAEHGDARLEPRRRGDRRGDLAGGAPALGCDAMIQLALPRARPARISSQTASSGTSRSGRRTSSQPPARATCMAIQPHLRPMTSTTKMRSREVAVSRILSKASMATLTAVSAPMAFATPATSLSIVAGMPTTGKP